MKKTLLTSLAIFFLLIATGNSFAQITSAGTGNASDPTTWVGGVIPSATDDVVIAAGHTVTLDAPTAEMKNLTIQGTLLFNKTVIVAMVVNGDILIESTGSFKVQSRTVTPSLLNTLDLKGNFTNNGTSFDFRTGSSGSTLGVCNLILSGTSNSTLTMSTSYSSSNGNFNAITINKTGGAKVILGSDIYIDGGSSSEVAAQSILTFVSGLVETGNFTLIHQTGTAANIVGASATSYVYGNLGRGMANSGGSSKIFDVGDATNYRPITIRSTTAGSATGHYTAVGIVKADANTGSSTLSGGIDKVSSVRYYKVTYNKGAGAASMSYDKFSPSYGDDDGVAAGNTNLRVAYSTDARATWKGLTQQTAAHTTVLSSTPTTIIPDSLAGTSWIVLNSGESFYVTLARLSGTTENTLGTGTSVEQTEGLPTSFELSQNYPNPFNPTTNISFSIPKSAFVTLKVYDITGKQIASLVNDQKPAGNYRYNFDATRLASGVYFYRIQAGDFVSTKKMVFMK